MPVRKRKDTGRFQGYYIGADGKQRSKDFDRMGDAKKWVAEQERNVRRGEWTDPNAAKVTVGELFPMWLATRSIKLSTRDGYEEIYRSCIEPEWGGQRIDRITPSEVLGWVANMRGKPRKMKGKDGLTVTVAPVLSAGRRRKAYTVLAGILDMAVMDADCPATPSNRPRRTARCHELEQRRSTPISAQQKSSHLPQLVGSTRSPRASPNA